MNDDIAASLQRHGIEVSTSGLSQLAVDGVMPRTIARPADEEGVATALREGAERGWRVIPRGGGTAIGRGNVPAGYDLCLDLTALSGVIEHQPRDLTLTVRAGTSFAVVQSAARAAGQLVALDPPLPARATVGGVVASDAWGPRRYGYGTARDQVIGVGAVLADGTVIRAGGRVLKNVAGYDLAKLLIGSHGTLAAITRVTFRLRPAPEREQLVTTLFDTSAAVCLAARRIALSGLGPVSLDLVSPGAVLGASEESWALVVGIAGTPAIVERQRADVVRLVREAGGGDINVLDRGVAQRVYEAVRDAFTEDEAAPFVLRTSVLPSRTGEAVALLEGHGSSAIVARAGNGVVFGAWTPPPPSVSDMVAELRAALAPLGGTLVVERCDPSTKAGLDVWGITGPDVALMRRVKAAYDPRGTLSPGRMWRE